MAIRISEPIAAARLFTIDRPGRRNALDTATYRQLTQAIADADDDPHVRVSVITGSGNVFTSGNDLGDFQKARSEPSAAIELLRALVLARKPIIAAVEGFAIGIGSTMLLHCDLVFAGRTTKFGMPFVQLGLCPEGGASLLLPQVAGLRRATEMLMLGETFGAEDAAACGLINGAVNDGEALVSAMDRARKLAAAEPESIQVTKMLLRRPQREAILETLDVEAVHFAERMRAPFAQQAFRRFLAKNDASRR